MLRKLYSLSSPVYILIDWLLVNRQEDIQEKFEKFGKITAVNCPKPIVVTQQIKDPNIGYAFVRFEDKRDREVALKAFNAGEISFHDSKVSVKPLVPAFWPTEQTRRFY